MDELLEQFLIEGPEQVAEGCEALMTLEVSPGDSEALDRAFRAIHTLKGSTGLFDMPAMATALHAAEDVLSELRSGRRRADGKLIDAMLRTLGQCDAWIAGMASGLVPPIGSADEFIASLAPSTPSAGVESTVALRGPPDWAVELARRAAKGAAQMTVVECIPDQQAYYRGEDPLALAAATPGLAALELQLTDAAPGEPYDPYICRLSFRLASTADAAEVRAVFKSAVGQFELYRVEVVAPTKSATSSRLQRIDQGRIDALAATAQDLAAASAGLTSLATRAVASSAPQSAELIAQSALLARAVGRLHDEVMALRMAPLAPMLRRYRRLARELAGELGKTVDLRIDDDGLEADRAVIDALADPLTHLVRNAVDHGVERPDERNAVGKPASGRLVIRARRAGAQLIVSLSDDGRGLDLDKISAKAVERGAVSRQALERMAPGDISNLIFLPGFSTADGVSQVSGRGVGMDAVRSAMSAIGGEVSISSRPGQGSEVVLVAPFSMTMSKIVVVRAGAERFGVLLDQIGETIIIRPGEVHPIRARHAIEWRDQTAPLFSLSELTGAAERPDLMQAQRALVIATPAGPVAVAVDQVMERLDVVLRPLTGMLARTPGVAGSTSLGDGALLLVLDLKALVP
ncbi:hypothetical protein ASE17_19980 [Phenylobacterium sp. Root77]|jgi:two-component system chemotaxis sensor kinase CheA|uniref:chemotaxis protein CheA n=1 Tax=unclassified Phenylobacterium TaxID=2640670 RepID=UPI00070147C4|nr:MULTISPECIES: chemotaxis protein CheA [unclassified Phenylobacterium]KQW66957.1 hypothetical protein ASC73_17625 [Phenylobacterium sp. Root1277]KQW89650.1 hypothetical protein ASC79_18530 [Phenylobacterium sp. Root1290]KRC43481.1 hypothetical protein ASE17_19980 [Phenylobacterium sp. Root77]